MGEKLGTKSALDFLQTGTYIISFGAGKKMFAFATYDLDEINLPAYGKAKTLISANDAQSKIVIQKDI